MHTVPGRCPICQQSDMIVTELRCDLCDTTIQGQFKLHKLHRLNQEQIQFVETFLLSEGKINRVGSEMGLTYPAVRSRLQEVIAVLSGQQAHSSIAPEQIASAEVNLSAPAEVEIEVDSPPSADTVSAERQREILAQVSEGKITAAEAAALLKNSGS